MADRSQLMIEMILDDKQALSRLGSAVSKMEKETKTATQSMTKSYAQVVAQITAVVAAGEGFRRFLGASIQQASEQEDAVNRLNVALKNQGTFTVGLSKSYQDMADSIQRSTRFSDDSILQAQQTFVTLGNVAPAQMARVTQAATNFATATKTDIQTSAELIAKAAAGNTSALARYGIVIDQTIPKGQRFSELLRLIEERMGGAATADVNTYAGAVYQLGNSWAEFQEKIGDIVIKSPEVIQSIQGIKQTIEEMTMMLQVASPQIQTFFDQFINAGQQLFAGGVGVGANLFDSLVGGQEKHEEALSRLKKSSEQANKITAQAKEAQVKHEALTENALTKVLMTGFKTRMEATIAYAQVTAEITSGLAMLSGKASLKAVAIVVQGIASALSAVAAMANPFLAILKISAIVINTAVALKQLSESEKALDEIKSQKFEAPSLPGLASGGTVSRGGSVLVGESGPEILRLPTGAQVIPLNRGGASSNLVINIEMNNPVLSNNQIADDFAQAIAERVSAFIDNERARL